MLDSIYDKYYIFKNIIKLLKYDTNEEQCLVPLKGRNLYAINKRIILKKRIGHDSVYGTIFYSTINNYKFITKIQLNDTYGSNEVNILKKIRTYVLKTLNFHLPLFIKNFTCKSYDIFDKRLPVNITEKYYYSYNSTLAELADGSIHEYIQKLFESTMFNIEKKLISAIKQCLIALMTLHYIGIYHRDAHLGNFLYHKVKNTHGYYQYNYKGKKFYLENTGAIFMVWDFGKSKPIEDFNFLQDYNIFVSYVIKHIKKYKVEFKPFFNDFLESLTEDMNVYKNRDDIIAKFFLDYKKPTGELLGTVKLF